ncbi:MAG: hypothetical protein H5T95_14085 [Firmicutes bacterium]|nr:hypothetical protein [Bacillota bacterium]
MFTGDYGQYAVDHVSDNAGGAITVFGKMLGETGKILAQHVNSRGVRKWSPDVVPICNPTEERTHFFARAGGKGKAFISREGRRDGNADVYAQHIDGNGNIKWATNGVPICKTSYNQRTQNMVLDGIGGTFIVWHDFRAGADIYPKIIDANVTVQWAKDDLSVIATAATQLSKTQLFDYGNKLYTRDFATADGSSGLIICWYDYRTGKNDIYAQRLNSSGYKLWNPDGIFVYNNAIFNKRRPQAMSYEPGEAIFFYEEDNNDGNNKPYTTRINKDGNLIWRRPIFNAAGASIEHAIATDSSGRAIVVWQGKRSRAEDIYAQRIDGNAKSKWALTVSPSALRRATRTATR